MLVPAKVSWWGLVFKYRGSELPRTQYRIAGVAAVALLVTVLSHLPVLKLSVKDDGYELPSLTHLPFTFVGVALGIFLGFRNNASYDRWWEGRKLWGAAVNWTRSFAREILTLIGPQRGGIALAASELDELSALRRELVYRVIAWTHALRLALRTDDNLADLEPFLSSSELETLRVESNRPYAITQGTSERIIEAWRRGWIHDLHLPLLETAMAELTNIQGGCERIKSTPIPFSYTTLIHRITAVYCYSLPFGIVGQVGWFTPFVCIIVAYAFFGLDVVGDEIEMPFGTDPNDLPLSAISRMIEVNLRQRLGEKELPPLLRPVDEVLD